MIYFYICACSFIFLLASFMLFFLLFKLIVRVFVSLLFFCKDLGMFASQVCLQQASSHQSEATASWLSALVARAEETAQQMNWKTIAYLGFIILCSHFHKYVCDCFSFLDIVFYFDLEYLVLKFLSLFSPCLSRISSALFLL